MSTIASKPRPVNPVETHDQMHQRFTSLGLRPGLPADLTSATLAIDKAIVARMRCPKCRRRSLTALVYTNDRNAYRILAACGMPGCNAAEEV